MKTFQKTDDQIKRQIITWFTLYYRQHIDNFSGHEQFTVFDKLPSKKQSDLNQYVQPTEQAVILLSINEKSVIICTTARFVYVKEGVTQELQYAYFDRHLGFKSIATLGNNAEVINVKSEGNTAEFGLQRLDGQIIYWEIPTGRSGFAFWNLTNKFAIIGRKYIRIPK